MFLFVICVAGGLRAQSDTTCAELSVKELKSALDVLWNHTSCRETAPIRLEAMAVLRRATDCFSHRSFAAYKRNGSEKEVRQAEKSGILYALATSFDRDLKEVKNTRVQTGGTVIWQVYNMGYIVKTPTAYFAIDIMHKHSDQLVPYIDFLLITHKHGDLDKYYHPEKYYTPEEIVVKSNLVTLFEEFIREHKLSRVRANNYRVIMRGLQRYELYVRATKRGQKGYVLYVDDVTTDTLRDMWDFFENECRYFEQYPAIYESIPEKRTPQPRGKNTLLDCFSRIRTFFSWCNNNKRSQNKPFDEFPLEECAYGAPYYITIDERNKIYATNLKRHPQLAIQRGIFVFQCLIGCRVGDLVKMTNGNLINGAIEYIPRKTKEGRPLTVRAPLNAIAQEIADRYKDGDKLLPFISEQKYNVAIKRIFKAAGLKRMVTVVNPTTRDEKKRVLYEIALSHLARRTFVGNLDKQVKDSNLVGSLSGHKDGSKAFALYREFDDQIKRELVDLLE